jgi:hypothetical protein
MLGKNVSILFYLKKPKNYASGPLPIYLRVTVDKEVAELSISQKCEPKQWDKKSKKVMEKPKM